MPNYEERILRSLRRITRSIDLYSRQLAHRYGLTGPQLVCLRTLLRRGPSTPSAIARDMDLSQATVTGILSRLEANGLLVRSRHDGDRRRVMVELTAKGANVVASAPSALQDIFSGRLAALSDADQQAILASLEQIVDMMGAGEMVPDPSLPASSEHLIDAQLLSIPVNPEANDSEHDARASDSVGPREENAT